MRLSSVLVTFVFISTILSVAESAKGETASNSSIQAEENVVASGNVPVTSVAIPVNLESEKAQTTLSEDVESEVASPPAEFAEGTAIAQNEAQDPRVLVAEVVVEGVEGELEDIVYQAINTRPGRVTTRAQLQEDVNAVFATGYFSNVRVVPDDTPLGVRVTFEVEPNPVLRNVQVQTIPEGAGQAIPPEVVDEIFGEEYGEILNLRQFQEDIKELNAWYQEQGFDLAQVVTAPEISPDGTVTLVVAEGVIEDIQVRFLDEEGEVADGRTREFIVTREVQLEAGDVFNRQTAQQDLQRVFGLGLFDDVRLSFQPGEDPTKVVVNLDVVEKNTGSVAAGAGVSSASGFFGTISYQEQNLGGNNQDIGAEVQVGTRELLFDARFTDPWIAGDPYRTSYTVNAFRRRSISLIFEGGENEVSIYDAEDDEFVRPRVVRTGGGVTFSRPLAPSVFEKADWTVSTGLQYQYVTIQDDDGDIFGFAQPEDRNSTQRSQLSFNENGRDHLMTAQLAAVRDKRNNPLRPTDGSFLRLGFDQSIPIDGILFNRLRGSYSYYMPVSFTNFSEGPQALAFNVQGGTVIGELPPYEAFSLGGSNSVRGYEEGDVGSGRSYLQATAEYRFPLFSVIGGALFFDYATDLGSADTVLGEPAVVRGKPGNGFGYGLGVRVQSPLGPIRVDYAINDDGDSRIHFGIGERF